MKRGERQTLKTNSGRQRLNLHGAIHAETHEVNHRSMGLPKRKNYSINNLGECTSRFVRLLELTPTVFRSTSTTIKLSKM